MSTRKCKFIAGKQWYPFLVYQEGRSRDISLLTSASYSPNNIYVRGTFNSYYYFSVFSDVIELNSYIAIFHPAYRCFDEIVVSNIQKPRFDVDIEDTKVLGNMDDVLREIINYLIDGIISLIPDISLEDSIRIYTSHGPNKRSLHMIIDGYCHDSHDNAKGFYKRVISSMPEGLKQYVDHGIYGLHKQLRIEGCTKWNDVRPKTLQESFMYRNRLIETKRIDNDIIRFAASLITHVVDCKLLPPFAIEKSVETNNVVVNDIVINAALTLASRKLGGEYTFELNKIMGSLVLLKRTSPSKCPTCKVIHEKEHPFLRVSGLDVYFNCRRNALGKSTHLGRVDEMEEADNETNNEANNNEGDDKCVNNGVGTFIIRNKNEGKGEFIIRNRCDEIETIRVVNEVEKTKVNEVRDTPSKVEIHKPTMKTSDILNSFSIIDRSTRRRKHRKVKDEESLSSIIDYNSIF